MVSSTVTYRLTLFLKEIWQKQETLICHIRILLLQWSLQCFMGLLEFEDIFEVNNRGDFMFQSSILPSLPLNDDSTNSMKFRETSSESKNQHLHASSIMWYLNDILVYEWMKITQFSCDFHVYVHINPHWIFDDAWRCWVFDLDDVSLNFIEFVESALRGSDSTVEFWKLKSP